MTVACHVIPASGRLVDVDIPELSESPWPGFDLNQHGTWASDSEDIRPETALGMAERRLTESPPDEESWGRGQWFKSRPDPGSPTSRLY